MRALFTSILATFLSLPGIVVLAALDASPFLWLPFGIDAAVIVLTARAESQAWLVPVLAAAGSAAGAVLTFWVGRKVGDEGLERFVPEHRLERIRKQVKVKGPVGVGILSMVPPPFPTTAVVLVAGALDISARVFFPVFAAARLLRFGAVAYLASRFGERILSWLESDIVTGAVAAFIGFALIVTVVSLTRLARASSEPSRRRVSTQTRGASR